MTSLSINLIVNPWVFSRPLFVFLTSKSEFQELRCKKKERKKKKKKELQCSVVVKSQEL